MTPNTIIKANITSNPSEIIEKWANENKFVLISSEGPERVYQKGVGFLVAPMMLKVRYENQTLTLTAWIRCGLFVRIMALMLLPAVMGIESGGFRGVLPRKIARQAINKLLTQLNMPIIN